MGSAELLLAFAFSMCGMWVFGEFAAQKIQTWFSLNMWSKEAEIGEIHEDDGSPSLLRVRVTASHPIFNPIYGIHPMPGLPIPSPPIPGPAIPGQAIPGPTSSPTSDSSWELLDEDEKPERESFESRSPGGRHVRTITMKKRRSENMRR